MLKLLAVAGMLAAGQLMFKRTAQGVTNVSGVEATFRQILVDPWFFMAMGLYVAATILWIFALREIPLSRAYPFMALAFVLVPAGAVFVYGEVVGVRYFVGLTLILLGIAVIGGGSSAKPLETRSQASHG